MNCGRRKVLPVDKLPAFFVHHLPNKNWWQRSECAVTVDELWIKTREWQRRWDAGDRSFVCGRYWDESWCQKDMKVIPAAERQKLTNTKGSCLAWRNLTSGEQFIQGPNEQMRAAGAVARAASEAAKKEAAKYGKRRLAR